MDALKQPEKYETEGAGNSSSRQLKGAARQSYKTKNKDSEETGAATENPLETVTEVKKDGVLSLVLPENTKVSGKSINIEETVSHRSLEKGTMDSYVGTDWYQKVLFHQYLVNYLGNYVEKKQDRVLEYELEYVLGGKANDAENLKIVVTELLAMREPLNMASLTASSQRQSEAMALAVTLAGVSANPAVIEAVKYGILVAWAFAESVLDVRTLLSGGKITMIKSDADWTSNVHMIPLRFVAKDSVRMERLMKEHGWNEKQALQRITESDNNRKGFHKSFFNAEIENPQQFLMVMNTGMFDVETASDVIVSLAKSVITPEKELAGKAKLQELINCQHLVNKLIFEYKLNIEFLRAVINGNTLTLQGVADSSVLVERAIKISAVELPGYNITSSISVVQDFKTHF